MSKLWLLLGRVGYFVTYPLVSLYLRRGERTRVVVRCGDRVLVVKSWLNKGVWDLPGGGLHKGEKPSKGASRELHEELGLQIAPSLFTLHKKEQFRAGLIQYPAYFMATTLSEVPKNLKLQKYEIVAAQWVSVEQLKILPMVSTQLNSCAREVLMS